MGSSRTRSQKPCLSQITVPLKWFEQFKGYVAKVGEDMQGVYIPAVESLLEKACECQGNYPFRPAFRAAFSGEETTIFNILLPPGLHKRMKETAHACGITHSVILWTAVTDVVSYEKNTRNLKAKRVIPGR